MTVLELREDALQRIVALRKLPATQAREDALRQATNDFMLACTAVSCGWPNIVEVGD